MAKWELDRRIAEYAVHGGAVLGGGGGGWIEDGLRMGRLAVELGHVELWSVDEVADDALLATVGLVGAPSASERHVEPVHYLEALELLRRQLDRPLAGIITNEGGPTATVNGWLQAAVTGLPVIDCPCNGRAHPTGVMGSLNLSEVPGYVSRQAAVGGAPGRKLQVWVAGPLERAAATIRRASVEAGGLVAVARNPVTAAYARQNGAPGAIRQAIAVGEAMLGRQGEAAIAAVADMLGGTVVVAGRVAAFALQTTGGFDVGTVTIEGGYELTFWNEYMTLERRGERLATFPDLMMTFDAATAAPLVSAAVAPGQQVAVLIVPRERLILGTAMRNESLLRPIEEIIHKPIVSSGAAAAP